MSDPFVYRSRAPEVIGAWKAGEAALHAYVDATEAVLKDAGLGEYQVWRSNHHWAPYKFSGLDVPEGEKPPAGWRMGKRFAVPDRRTKAGKAIEAALNAVRHPGSVDDKLPGMPADICYPGGFTSPGISLLEDGTALYVSWNIDPAGARESFRSKSTDIDAALWDRAPLSEYYAAKEADEARRAADKSAA